MAYTFDAAHGPGVSGASAPVNNGSTGIESGSKSLDSIDQSFFSGNTARSLSSGLQEMVNYDPSDFGDAIRNAMDEYNSSSQKTMDSYIKALKEVTSENNALSQANAREMMEYQRESDKNAMSWSAAEAQKVRDYQERLANTAHQREVKDLIKAGLNPILAANNGAYTGSGATGQAFSSSGAMGTVDTAASSGMASMMSSIVNAASGLAQTAMYNQASKYSNDMQYAIAKLASETSLYTNMNTNEANKAMNRISSDTSLATADMNMSAILGSAGLNLEGVKFNAEKHLEGINAGNRTQLEINKGVLAQEKYKTEKQAAIEKYKADRAYAAAIYESRHRGVVGQVLTGIETVLDVMSDAGQMYGVKKSKRPSYGARKKVSGDAKHR